MEELLTNSSPALVVFCFFLVLFALKEGIEIVSYFINLIKKKADKDNSEAISKKEILDKLDGFEARAIARDNQIAKVAKDVDLLIQSDKDDIKGWIVERHHHFMKQGWVDTFSLDVLEKRYKHYKKEGGNSFITDLMNEIRALPKTPPVQ